MVGRNGQPSLRIRTFGPYVLSSSINLLKDFSHGGVVLGQIYVFQLSRNNAIDQVDLKQPVEPRKLTSFTRNTFGYSSDFLSSLHLNILPHLSTSDYIVPTENFVP